MSPSNPGWHITPGDLLEIRRNMHPDETPRIIEACHTCHHSRRVHDLPGPGESCSVCGGPCKPAVPDWGDH